MNIQLAAVKATRMSVVTKPAIDLPLPESSPWLPAGIDVEAVVEGDDNDDETTWI